jgi:predicted lipoprotein with Yx(FWY)xxD motif
MIVRPFKQSRSARRLVQTCALAVIPLLFSACTAAVPGVPATNAPMALATPAKSAVTKPPSTKGVTTKGGVATGAVGTKTGTSTSSATGTNTSKTGTTTSSTTTGANTSKTGTSTSSNAGTNTSKTGANTSSSTTGANTSKTGTSTSSTTGTNTSKTGASTSSSTTAGTANSSTSAASAASAAAGELVMLRPNGTHGSMLTDAKGMTLYVFDKDSKDKSTCTGACLAKWPAFTVASAGAAMKAAAGVTGQLGTIKRDDGTLQVTINGMPLYHYYLDKQAGDAKGEAVGNVWWEVGANGSKITQ